ncbi:MAG: hypothetical protein LUI12_10185 [Clostridiales bacterium]|nr:hypothetical protein [Clostridiales bacterium]
MQKAFQIERTQAYPLGVCFQAEGLHISAVFDQKEQDGAGEKGVLLYDQEHREGVRLPFPEEYRVGSVYSMLLKGYQDRACSYLFYQGEELLQDPRCKQIDNPYRYGEARKSLPRCRVQDVRYRWEGDCRPAVPYQDMILYSLHVRGFTKHRSSQVRCKGTYAGIVEKIPYMKELGVTSVLLMPAYEFDELLPLESNAQPMSMEQAVASYRQELPASRETAGKEDGYRINYWGYQKGLYYIPKSGYAYGRDAVTEYKDMVRAMHQNGMEVLMQFYFPAEVSPLDMMDIMRYWVTEYHIDGFQLMGTDLPVELFVQEPLLSETKILTERRYHLKDGSSGHGRPAMGWLNDGFLYDMRRFLKGDDNLINSFLFHIRHNTPEARVVNYMAKWDGFRLADLVSYDRKHNEQNGEDNQDGNDYNCSWNCGAEGKSRKKSILKLRTRQMKNAMSLLFLSQGTPLLYSGDEFGNTQEGNNNPYCQDNAVSWVKWNRTESGRELLDYTKMLIRLRKEYPVLHSAEPLRGMDYLSCGYPDLSFHGKEAWSPDTGPASRTMGLLYCGAYGRTKGEKGDDLLYIGVNMHWISHTLGLPQPPRGKMWQMAASTYEREEAEPAGTDNPQEIRVEPRTIEIYTLRDCPEPEGMKNKRKANAKNLEPKEVSTHE